MIRLSTLFGACCVAAVTGCSFSGQIAEHAVAYNKSVAQSENEMLLLNIMRASQQQPMYFTRVSELTGALEANLSSSLEVPFGGDAMDIFTAMFSVSGASKPTYNVEVLDSKEFYNGFLKPIDFDTFSLFVASGWPIKTLINALVEEAEVYVDGPEDKVQTTCKIIANPDQMKQPKKADYYPQQMMGYLSTLLSESRSVTRQSTRKPFGRPLPISSVSDIAALADLREAGLEPVDPDDLVKESKNPSDPENKNADATQETPGDESNGFVQLVFASETVTFGSPKTEANKDFLARADKAFSKPSGGFCGDKPRNDEEPKRAKIEIIKDAAESEEKTLPFVATLTLRSARGVLYALGEMVNLRQAARSVTISTIEPDKLGYFHVASGGPPPPDAISTHFNGKAYWIPTDMGRTRKIGRETRRLLALAQQVFSLNSAAEDAPTTQTIRFIQ